MEERLKVEVQISSYDAKGLQCFVAEQIQKYRPEESGPKKMFKRLRALWLREYHARQNCSLH